VNRSFQQRCLLLCSVLVAGLSLLSGRLVQIQLVDRQRYAASARKAFDRTEKLTAIRGMIVDRNEETIAKSIPVSTVFVDKNHLMDPKLASYGIAYQEASADLGWERLDPGARRRRIHSLRGEILSRDTADTIVQKHLAYAIGVLARPLGMRREELRAKIEDSKGMWVPIAKDLPEDVADRLRTSIDEPWIQGFNFENAIKRWYTSPDIATHLTGFIGEIKETDDDGLETTRIVGQFGIEAAMEAFLAGRDGWRKHRRDQRGLIVPGDSGSLLPPRSGLHVQLALDLGIQSIVEEELDAALAEYKATGGSVVLLDPKTGDVLALASRPHFNLNERKDIGLDGLLGKTFDNTFNYAVQGSYEPGSTFKVVATTGGLDLGLVRPQTTIFCHHGVLIEGKIRIPDHHPYGNLTFQEILAKSSNIGTYKIAKQLGNKRFYDYVDGFGFGSKTGIMLSGETRGIVHNTGNAMDFSRATYGYALAVTPLQVASAYCAIANDGSVRKPRIVKALVHNDGTIVDSFKPEITSVAMKPATAALMRTALETVTQKGGTATLAAVPGFRVAGKTGTAKKIRPSGGYYDSRYTVSFAGMMPAQDPAFVCLVVIDDPGTTELKPGGGSMAAPTFQKIASRVATRMNLQPTEPVTDPLATAAAQ
jgi:cell division protein FtsI/penicillin-binding protein 2